MDPLVLGGLGLGLIGGIGSLFGAKRANKRIEQLIKQNPAYQANPIAQQRMGLASTLLNARMPGAAAAERNIYTNQANAMANVNRNATDSSQALALGAATQGQTNQAFGNLGMQEAQDYQRRYGNLVGAQEGVIQEGDKVHNDSIRRYQDLVSLRGAQNTNTQGAWNSLTNLGLGAASVGMAGGMNQMFGGGQQRQPGGYYYGTDRDLRPSMPRLANY
jgi:hypothetical protein